MDLYDAINNLRLAVALEGVQGMIMERDSNLVHKLIDDVEFIVFVVAVDSNMEAAVEQLHDAFNLALQGENEHNN